MLIVPHCTQVFLDDLVYEVQIRVKKRRYFIYHYTIKHHIPLYNKTFILKQFDKKKGKLFDI